MFMGLELHLVDIPYVEEINTFIHESHYGINLPRYNQPKVGWVYILNFLSSHSQGVDSSFHIQTNMSVRRGTSLVCTSKKASFF